MYHKISRNSIKQIKVIITNCDKTLQQIVASQRCNYAINGGLYDMTSGELCNIPLRVDGNTLANSSDGYWGFAWNFGQDFCLVHSNDMNKWKNFIACTALLKDGGNTWVAPAALNTGIRGRTGIGDDPEYIHLAVTTDKSGACSTTQWRAQAKNNGASNFIMMDCGGSSQGYFDGVYAQGEKRKVRWWICIWTKDKDGAPLNKIENPYAKPTKTIYPNSNKEYIKWLQWELVNRGFLDNSDKKQIDGIIGNNTRTATKNLQRALGFTGREVDGVCGPKTLRQMEERNAS